MNAAAHKYPSLGIVGGGQLGKMLAAAAGAMGIECSVLDPSSDAVAMKVARHLCAPFDDETALRRLFGDNEFVTYEFENVSIAALEKVGGSEKLAPNTKALQVANDRIREKEFFSRLGLEVAPYVALTETSKMSPEQLSAAVTSFGAKNGYPLIVKTCALGYDGKGQVMVGSAAEAARASVIAKSDRLIIEKKVSFSRELSVLAVRNRKGEIAIYPTPVNEHREGILHTSIVVEAEPNASLAAAAQKIMNELSYVGVLAVEFFEVDGRMLANEMAPRVHNSGHWSIEGSVTSQFENHVRAVMDLPLGSTELRFPTAMVNLIGRLPNTKEILKIPGTHLHLYGKQPREGRKIGHVTIEAKDCGQLESRLEEVIQRIGN